MSATHNCVLSYCENHMRLPAVTADEIYAQYPRKVARPVAIKSIAKACERLCPRCLLERTELYAAARRLEDPAYTPHPATWFNQERYNDDPSTWSRRAANPRNSGISDEVREQGRKIAQLIKQRQTACATTRNTTPVREPMAAQVAGIGLL